MQRQGPAPAVSRSMEWDAAPRAPIFLVSYPPGAVPPSFLVPRNESAVRRSLARAKRSRNQLRL